MKLSDIGEFNLIKRILDLIPKDNRAISYFDDAIMIDFKKFIIVIKSDGFVASTDLLPGMTAKDIGWKTAVMNLSDLAAKGVSPQGCSIILGVEREREIEYVLDIYRGLIDASRKYNFYIWGGDLNEAEDLIVGCTMIGFAKDKVVTRSGAKPGDILAVTGMFGYTSLAYKILLEGYKIKDRKLLHKVLKHAYRPEARVKEGLILKNFVSASIDSSDGLAISLNLLSKASNVKIIVENIPIPVEIEKFALKNNIDVLELVLYEGGEEYELIYSIPPHMWEKACNSIKKCGGNLYPIGKVVKGKGVYLKKDDKYESIPSKGYQHFNSS
ncbi:MAG TPA: thiamine-phosphate kinase [Thermoprotei archaeon]|nr:thiamine-phosphate kinase [Thermoprotei archaeon]